MQREISGMMFYYYFVCKRKLWFFANEIQMESENEDVIIGKLIGWSPGGHSPHCENFSLGQGWHATTRSTALTNMEGSIAGLSPRSPDTLT